MICWLTAIVVNSIFTDICGQMRGVADPTVRFATWARQAEKTENKNASCEFLMEFSVKRIFFSVRVSTDSTPTCSFAQRDAYTRLAEGKLEISDRIDIRDSDVFRNNMKTLCACMYVMGHVILIYIFIARAIQSVSS